MTAPETETVVAAHVAVAGDRMARSERNATTMAWTAVVAVVLVAALTAAYLIGNVNDTARRDQVEELRRTVARIEAEAAVIRRQLTEMSTGLGIAHENNLRCLRTGQSCPP